MATHTTIGYSLLPRISRLAIASLVLGVISVPLFFLVIPGVIALVFAWTAGFYLQRSPERLGGEVYLVTGRRLAAASLFMGVAFFLLVPSCSRTTRGEGRGYCAANLRGIMQSCNIYAADNSGVFPLVPYAPYTAALNSPSATSGAATDTATLAAMYGTPPANVAGSPLANLWILVIKSQVAPKQFMCRSDPFYSYKAAPQTVGGLYQTNFESGSKLSYSVAYPWTADGRRGGWWRDLTDSTLPLIADMSPRQGTGSPARVVNPAAAPRDPKSWNSDNHNGDGQNVGYSDVHASFERTPTIGQERDNIFATTGTGLPGEFGGRAATPLFPEIPALPPNTSYREYGGPFDIIMVPVRNASNGSL
jgi:hypothetical protein